MINKTELTNPTIVTAVVEGLAPQKAESMMFMGLFLTWPLWVAAARLRAIKSLGNF